MRATGKSDKRVERGGSQKGSGISQFKPRARSRRFPKNIHLEAVSPSLIAYTPLILPFGT